MTDYEDTRKLNADANVEKQNDGDDVENEDQEYEVGYGKPPKNRQFKKGRSGNSKGRPKGTKNIRTVANEILNRTVTITENGRSRNVKFIEAFLHQMAAKALNGTTRDQIMLFKAICDYAPELVKDTERLDDITITYVLPEGKTMEDYDNPPGSSGTLDNDPKTSSAEERSDTRSDEDDSYLD